MGCTLCINAVIELGEELRSFVPPNKQLVILSHIDKNGLTLLHASAAGGHTGISIKLVESGANIKCEDYWKKTPIHYSAGGGHTETVIKLAELGANID